MQASGASTAFIHMTSFGDLFLTSFKVIANLFVQYGITAAIAWRGVIKESDMRAFSAIMNVLLIPLLSMVSLGRGLSLDLFASDGWVLSLIGLVTLSEFALLAFLLRPLAQPTPQFRRLFVLMMTIGNVVAIPLSITQSLCELGAFDDEFETDECVLRSRALVFMYVFFNSFCIWVVCFGYLQGDQPEVAETKSAGAVPAGAAPAIAAPAAAPAPGADTPGVPLTPTSSKTLRAADVALASPAQDSEAGSSAASSPVRKASNRRLSWVTMARGTGSRQSMANVLSGQSPLPAAAGPGARVSLRAFLRRQMASLFKRPPVVGLLLGLTIALIKPLQRALFKPDAPLEPIGQALAALSEGAVPVINCMLGFSLGHKLRGLSSWKQLLGSQSAGISPRTMLVLTLGRMVLLPVCHGAILYGVLDQLPSSRLTRVIVFVEAAPPTASIVVVLSHMARKPRSAQLAAWAVIPQYLVAIISLTLVITFALAVTEP